MNEREKALFDSAKSYVQNASDPNKREGLCTSVISYMLHTLNQRLGLLTPQEQAQVVAGMSLTEQLIYRAMRDTIAPRLQKNSLTVHENDEQKDDSESTEKKYHGRARNRT